MPGVPGDESLGILKRTGHFSSFSGFIKGFLVERQGGREKQGKSVTLWDLRWAVALLRLSSSNISFLSTFRKLQNQDMCDGKCIFS